MEGLPRNARGLSTLTVRWLAKADTERPVCKEKPQSTHKVAAAAPQVMFVSPIRLFVPPPSPSLNTLHSL